MSCFYHLYIFLKIVASALAPKRKFSLLFFGITKIVFCYKRNVELGCGKIE